MLGQLFYFYSLAALYLQHTQHLGTKTTPDTQFAGVGERTREGKLYLVQIYHHSIERIFLHKYTSPLSQHQFPSGISLWSNE